MSPKLADKVPCSQIGYMPLNMTKIAFGCESLPDLQRRIESRAAQNGGEMLLTTRYRPKRHEEMVGGSLYWIIT